jgi:Pyruvate/2-oxoacid:ferredoxin oxidoreductase delta subunit
MGRNAGLALLVLAALVVIAAASAVDLAFFERTNTYGDFDAPSEQAFVHYLLPGIPDQAIEKVYRFTGEIHAGPIVALLAIFAVFLVLRTVGSIDLRLGIHRWLTAWAAFVVARFGLLRVSGASPVRRCTYGVFPFLNCQACEMASGGCPIGMFQASLLHLRLPVLALSVMMVTGLALGRWICGWLCPFGMLSDMFDRVSKRAWKPRHGWAALKFVVLGALVAVPLLMAGLGGATWLPFCGTLCPSGSVFGLLPYYATTGATGFLGAFAAGGAALAIVLFHVAVLAGFVILAVKIGGRVFCRYLCPLGAFLGLFHRISFVRVVHDGEHCRECGKCEKSCPMAINLGRPDFLTQSNCVLCGRCVNLCPTDARRWRIGWAPEREKELTLAPRAPEPTHAAR